MYRRLPPIPYLHQRLRLNKRTGFLYWKRQPNMKGSWNVRFAGKRAGAKKFDDYRMIRINGVSYLEHRIVFAMATGKDPRTRIIDHKKPCKSNRPRDLQAVTPEQNVRRKTKLSSKNTSGVTGVHWSTQSRKWFAQIMVREKRIYLGVFSDLKEAALVRRVAEKKYFGAFAPDIKHG
jgi:hypothetical protein